MKAGNNLSNSAKFTGMFFIYLIVFILTAVSVTCYKAYATDIPCGSTYKSKFRGETVRCVVPTPKPAPIPTPAPTPKPTATPIPTPVPTPKPSPSPGVVCSKTVSKVGDAQSAVNASVAGQTVCMEPGTYNFTVAFYPRTGVRIYCKPGAKLVFDGGSQEAVRFNTNVTGATVEGCDISGGWDGVKDTGKNNVTRNNYIHNNKYQGWLCAGCIGSTLEKNRIENNGMHCEGWPNPVDDSNISPRHCHDAYVSNPSGYCAQMTGIKILNNDFGPSGGFGVSVNGYFCPSNTIDGTVIENNTFTNNNAGVGLYYYTRNTVIKSNSFTMQNLPASNMSASMKNAITVWGGAANEPTMTRNTYKLKAGYGEFKRY